MRNFSKVCSFSKFTDWVKFQTLKIYVIQLNAPPVDAIGHNGLLDSTGVMFDEREAYLWRVCWYFFIAHYPISLLSFAKSPLFLVDSALSTDYLISICT